MGKLVLWVYLLVLAVFDLREQKVPVVLLVAGSAMALIWRVVLLLGHREGWQWEAISVCAGMMPGMIMLAVAKFTGKAGLGDGWVLLNLGLFTDYKTSICLWGFSLLAMAVFCAVIFVFKRVHKNTQIPYLPFLVLVDTVGILI